MTTPQVERERRACKAGGPDAADDVERVADHRRTARRAARGESSKLAPPFAVEHEHSVAGRVASEVAADDDRAATPRCGHRMVDGDGNVGQAPPTLLRRRVRVRPRGRVAPWEIAAGDDELGSVSRRSHLRSWHGQWLPPLPARRGGRADRWNDQRHDEHRSSGTTIDQSAHNWAKGHLNPLTADASFAAVNGEVEYLGERGRVFW